MQVARYSRPEGPENSHDAMRCNKTLQIYSKLNCLIFRTDVSRETARYCTSYSNYQCIAAKGRRTALLFIVVPLPFPGASDHMFPLLFPGAMDHRVSLILECLVKTIGSIAQAFQMLHKIVCPFHGHQETVATVC